MRFFAVVVVTIGCGTAPTPAKVIRHTSVAAPETAVTLVYVPRVVGDRFRELQALRLDIRDNGVPAFEMRDVDVVREVTALEGGEVASETSHYRVARVHTEHDGIARSGPSIAGHAYRVTWHRFELTIARADGAALSEDERRWVEADHADLGAPAKQSRFLASRTWKVGEEVALAAIDQLDVLGEIGWDASMTLTEVTADAATFTTHSHGRVGDGIEVEATATLTIDRATGRLKRRTGTSTFTGGWEGKAEATITITEQRRTLGAP